MGPAPSTGYHFISDAGVLSNTGTSNLLKNIGRVQSASYGINVTYSNIVELGKRGLVSQPIISAPSVNLGFDFLHRGVINELRLGLICNYTNDQGSSSSAPFYPNNFGVSLISGLVTREFNQPTSYPYWPLSYRDKRNIFIVVAPEGEDVNKATYFDSDPANKNFAIYSFGDCYLNSYTARASVGQLPSCSVSYICENLELLASGTGVTIPAVNPQTYSGYTGITFNIPTSYDGGVDPVAALLPGDINLSFTSYPPITGVLAIQGTGYSRSADSSIVDLGASFPDFKIQDYEISMGLSRDPLYAIGYEAPVDRIISFPVFANLSISAIIGDNQTGALWRLSDKNKDYDVTISLRNPANADIQGIGLRYDFKRAKLNSFNYSSTIGSAKVGVFNWSVEIDPSDLSKGLFISGLLNVDFSRDFLLTRDDNSKFLLSDSGGFILSRYLSQITY
jgi:hypothetical protein